MTPYDYLMFGMCAFVSGLLGMGLGYLIRDFQMIEYMREIDKNMKEVNILADIIRKEKEDAD